jgi:hypothetical protein
VVLNEFNHAVDDTHVLFRVFAASYDFEMCERWHRARVCRETRAQLLFKRSVRVGESAVNKHDCAA